MTPIPQHPSSELPLEDALEQETDAFDEGETDEAIPGPLEPRDAAEADVLEQRREAPLGDPDEHPGADDTGGQAFDEEG